MNKFLENKIEFLEKFISEFLEKSTIDKFNEKYEIGKISELIQIIFERNFDKDLWINEYLVVQAFNNLSYNFIRDFNSRPLCVGVNLSKLAKLRRASSKLTKFNDVNSIQVNDENRNNHRRLIQFWNDNRFILRKG
ncbi:MAG: hypothetical protein WA839_10225 [Flavobacteriaceae bacterium]